MVACAYNPSTWGTEAGECCKFETNLVAEAPSKQAYLVSPCLTQRNKEKNWN